MIKHIVFWTLKDNHEGVNKQESLPIMKQKLDSLAGKIEGLHSLEVGINKNTSPEAYDICLITQHSTWEALQIYQDHPLHKEVVVYVGGVRKSRAVVDFEY
jgi:hypothetical protein